MYGKCSSSDYNGSSSCFFDLAVVLLLIVILTVLDRIMYTLEVYIPTPIPVIKIVF